IAVKFFIQKDLATEIQAELCDTITTLGGRVESKVPRQGFMLTQPGSAEAERLRLCWNSRDRPERYFVPYSYVEACKIAGTLLKQIFLENGEPIKFFIHPSIANPNARAALSARIAHSGGDPMATAQNARVILADPNTEVFQHLVNSYQGVPDKYVESFLWVKKCVERSAVNYTPLIYKNPGGRRPGEERTQFSEEDEQHLCHWIATKIPYKETGGRTGNRLYQQLVEMVTEPEFAWVTRHTWQSWRERYKKNSTRLDTVIQAIVEQKKTMPGEKGQYGYVRKPEEKKRNKRRKTSGAEPTEEDDFLNMAAAGAGPPPPPPPQPQMPNMAHTIQMPMPGQEMHHGVPPPGMGGMMYGPPPPPPPPELLQQMRASPAEEEMEEEGPEWTVRVGNEPPPAWGKRRAEEEHPGDDNDPKRLRTADEQQGVPQPPHPMLGALGPNGGPNGMHVVDQGILDIAREYRFTVEEVHEYYDRCGAMDRTRARFQKMRETLNALEDDAH
ncbi:uncharacterized protein STEHIDRAFT_47261, partial [Stereum hirsutum FP-91666 SS1]|uniref:uncharacterized protein n=1 Tax=Stereum hirsutum (strain FP-91666) TaxID=721885 RepID=UPI000440F8D7